jgi:hypothetical protein
VINGHVQGPGARLTVTLDQRTIGTIAESGDHLGIILPASAVAGFFLSTKTEGRNHPRAEE